MTGIIPDVVHLSGSNLVLVIIVFVVALGALAMAYMFRQEVLAAGEGTDNMKNIAHAVQEGANAYLQRQFRTLAVFAAIAFFALMLLPADDWGVRIGRSLFFLVGAGFSAAVGYFGMNLAVRANLRVASAANTEGRERAMSIGFRTGAMVGMMTVGLGLLGASAVVLLFKDKAPHVLEGFGFGAALLAMFMRVGGGIFTKAADVGADLVGKVEQGIPEDDPRNAATIADNVGDNVGDCAGMAADLFESYAVTLVAALILGSQAFGDKGLVLPAADPDDRCSDGGRRRLPLQAPRRRERPADHQQGLLHLRGDQRCGLGGPLLRLPAEQLCRPRRLRDHRHRRPPVHHLRCGADRHRAGGGDPGADRLLHRHRLPPGQGRRQDLADRSGDGDPVRHRGRSRVGRLHHAGDRRRGVRGLPARWRHQLSPSRWPPSRWRGVVC